jgi:hypothetical protein
MHVERRQSKNSHCVPGSCSCELGECREGVSDVVAARHPYASEAAILGQCSELSQPYLRQVGVKAEFDLHDDRLPSKTSLASQVVLSRPDRRMLLHHFGSMRILAERLPGEVAPLRGSQGDAEDHADEQEPR